MKSKRDIGLPAWVARTKTWIEYLAFRLIAAIFSALPLESAAELSALGWSWIAPLSPRHRRALDHLARALPETSPAEREGIARAMWKNLGRTFVEFFHFQQIYAEGRVEFDPLDDFEAVAGTAPFVICIPHLGNWEFASHAGLKLGLRFAGTYQALTNPLVDAWIYEQRKPFYSAGLFPKSPATARAMLRLPRQGVCTAFVADLRERAGVPTQFFGREAWSNPFPALIARSNDLPVYAACVIRTGRARFRMHIERVETCRTEDRDADVRAITQNIQSAFEGFVRRWPEQWMWAHKRWD